MYGQIHWIAASNTIIYGLLFHYTFYAQKNDLQANIKYVEISSIWVVI